MVFWRFKWYLRCFVPKSIFEKFTHFLRYFFLRKRCAIAIFMLFESLGDNDFTLTFTFRYKNWFCLLEEWEKNAAIGIPGGPVNTLFPIWIPLIMDNWKPLCSGRTLNRVEDCDHFSPSLQSILLLLLVGSPSPTSHNHKTKCCFFFFFSF